MKSFFPWVYIVAATGSQAAYAMTGLEDYRIGNYSMASQSLLKQKDAYPIANFYLGRMRLYGYGDLKNDALALNYFEKAGEKGVLFAQQFLARYYLNKANDPEKALYWFKKSATLGDINAQLFCTGAYLYGFGTKKNEDIARRYYIDAARGGNAIAQATLGEYFLVSRDTRNKKLGLIWINKSVEQGNPKAFVLLATLYASGTIVAKDLNKSKELLSQAANDGYVPAMRKLGELALQEKNYQLARDWFAKAASNNDKESAYLLAQLYQNNESGFANPQTSFMWMLQAAQNGVVDAQTKLAQMYQTGTGVNIDQTLAMRWEEKAKEGKKLVNQEKPAIDLARWLSNDKQTNFNMDGFRLSGIYTAWQNPLALKENNYNTSPQMKMIKRSELYKPNFVMIQPKEIAINEYFDVIAPALNATPSSNVIFPRYPLDSQIEALLINDSYAVNNESKNLISGIGNNHKNQITNSFDYLNNLTPDWERQLNYQAILSQLYDDAILGESAAQFELGQLYHYGIAVTKNVQQAMTYYQLAAIQQDIRAEYNLGMLYLEGQTNPANYKQGIVWLSDAAFKGNVYAQYVLARIYENGFKDAAGNMVIDPDPQQAMGMYHLAASNHYAPAQYSLAEYLIKHANGGMSVAAKNNRTRLIKKLYEGAVKGGVAEASLPLAFYNAMDSDTKKQKHAFDVASEQAKSGNVNAALLLAMMYERGISVPPNSVEAMYWYQQAPLNPVNAFILGTYYSQGIQVNKDAAQGKALLKLAAEADFSYANLNLAILKHEHGEEFLDDLNKAKDLGNSTAGLLLADYYLAQADSADKMEKARAIYQLFAEKGDKEAQLKLGYLYDQGLGGKIDTTLAEKWYTAAAEQGQPVAQYLLGNLFQLGKIGTEPDYAQAKKWYAASQSNYTRSAVALGFLYDTVDENYNKAKESYELAAHGADQYGQFNLGLIYENGKGMPVDYLKAESLYSKAAEAGHRKSMTQLATLYFNGSANGKREPQKALYWYQKAADLGDSDALYQLGLLSETGIATKLDFANAISYYKKAANKGNEKAKLALARMYQYGLGIPTDKAKASELYKELANNENAFAQYQLATLVLEGALGDKNLEEGRKLLQQASANGSRQARRMLQWQDAEKQERVSFIEPAVFNVQPILAGQPADLMYFNALNEWNRGDETTSRMILDKLLTQFPQYTPARKAYEQLQEPNVTLSHNEPVYRF